MFRHPSQGSAWEVGDSMSIMWDTAGLGGTVAISLSSQGGKVGTFETIAETTENDGSYPWTVTGPASVNCVLRIEPIGDVSKGTSQGLFTISGEAVPTVTTAAVSSITMTSAENGGDVISDGGASVTACGRLLEHLGQPTINDAHTSNGEGSGSFTSSISGLSPGTIYYIRAYATNSAEQDMERIAIQHSDNASNFRDRLRKRQHNSRYRKIPFRLPL